jgi:hypothetical protein
MFVFMRDNAVLIIGIELLAGGSLEPLNTYLELWEA